MFHGYIPRRILGDSLADAELTSELGTERGDESPNQAGCNDSLVVVRVLNTTFAILFALMWPYERRNLITQHDLGHDFHAFSGVPRFGKPHVVRRPSASIQLV